jgi:hypothetical protein
MIGHIKKHFANLVSFADALVLDCIFSLSFLSNFILTIIGSMLVHPCYIRKEYAFFVNLNRL